MINRFDPNVPGTESRLQSEPVRDNFNVLNDRSNQLTATATTPVSTSIRVGPADKIYFEDNTYVPFPGGNLDLGNTITGVSAFNTPGTFKEIIVYYTNVGGSGTLGFIESLPTFTKVRNTQNLINDATTQVDPVLGTVNTGSNLLDGKILVCSILVTNNGTAGQRGQIVQLGDPDMIDLRPFMQKGGGLKALQDHINAPTLAAAHPSALIDNASLIVTGRGPSSSVPIVAIAVTAGSHTITMTGNILLFSVGQFIRIPTSSIAIANVHNLIQFTTAQIVGVNTFTNVLTVDRPLPAIPAGRLIINGQITLDRMGFDIASALKEVTTNPQTGVEQFLRISFNGTDTLYKLALNTVFDENVAAAAAIAYSKLNLALSIVNADISASAAIVYSKLTLSNSIVNADINTAAAIAYSKLNLSNSIVNADINTAAAIAYSKLNLALSIVNADISASAAIARAKIATGTANHVIINDGTGLLSSEAQLAITRGGTGQSSATAAFNALSPMTTLGDLIYGAASGTGTRLPGNITVLKKLLTQAGSGAASAAPVWNQIDDTAYFTTGAAASATSIGILTITTQTIAGDKTLSGNTTQSGTLSVTNATSSTTSSTGALKVTGGVGILENLNVGGIIKAGTGPTTLTDAVGKILSAALNTVQVAQGGTGQTNLPNNTIAPIVGSVLRANGTSAVQFVDFTDSDVQQTIVYRNTAVVGGEIRAGRVVATLASNGLVGDLSSASTVAGTSASTIASLISGATSSNTPSTLVLRDGSGNFAAGTITANLSGTATNVTGTVLADHGGTGQIAYAIGDTLYATASATVLSKLTIGALNSVMTSTGTAPQWTAGLTNSHIAAAAGIVYSKLNLALSIVNGDVSASAAIAFSKLAALPSANILVGSAGAVATAVAVTGDITISNTGVTTIGSGKVTSSMILDDTIVNADINTTAAIARSKLASGTADHVIINDATGVLSSEAQLSVPRGGTAASSFTVPSSGNITLVSASGTSAFSSTTATSTNTNNTVVLRNSTGDFASRDIAARDVAARAFLGGAFSGRTIVQTSNYTLDSSPPFLDMFVIFDNQAASANVTFTLPATPTDGRTVILTNISGFSLIVNGNGNFITFNSTPGGGGGYQQSSIPSGTINDSDSVMLVFNSSMGTWYQVKTI